MNWFFKFILLPLLISTQAFPNVLGDMQTFVPNTDGLDFITVHTSRPLYGDYLVLSQYVNFAKDHLLVFKNINTQEKMSYANELAEYDFSVGYGLTQNLSVYLQAPFLWYYQSETKEGIKINIDKGVHSLRPGFKYSFGDAEIPSWAVLASIDIPSLVDSPYTGVNPAPIYNMELVYTRRNEKAVHGFNAGMRVRSPSERPVNQRMFPLDDQLTLSYGYSNEFSESSRWVFETFYSYPLEKKPYMRAEDASSLDLLLGLKHRWWKNTNFDWGATVEPGVDSLAPAWRLFAGIVWYWKPNSNEKVAPVQTRKPTPARTAQTGFRVTPEDTTVVVGEQVAYEFIGGKGPYQCEILSGGGQFIGKYCDFLAPENPGSSEIEFKDSLGQTTTAIVNYKSPSEFAGDLGIRPNRAEIFEGQTIQFRAVGGKAPFRYGVIDGSGTINSDGLFKAPLSSQNVMIEVVDAVGRSATASILVKEIPRPDKLIRLKNLEFEFDRDTLTPKSKKEMEKIISTLFDLNIKSLIIEGHTDSLGKDEYNQNLSERRAKTIKNILLDNLDIRDNQITAIGFGEARPIATNKTDAGRAKNRRVDMKVYIKK
ncbi:MAG: OmpA family protein [Bdellovibrionaceae bacterium]|nr:OmpA family protein [Pseudobdellovibrionaceae bacterium]